jgi:hypothetical protein
VQFNTPLSKVLLVRKLVGIEHFKNKSLIKKGFQVVSGGEGGIRTLGTFDSTPDFESGTFDHSATSPNQEIIIASDM